MSAKKRKAIVSLPDVSGVRNAALAAAGIGVEELGELIKQSLNVKRDAMKATVKRSVFYHGKLVETLEEPAHETRLRGAAQADEISGIKISKADTGGVKKVIYEIRIPAFALIRQPAAIDAKVSEVQPVQALIQDKRRSKHLAAHGLSSEDSGE